MLFNREEVGMVKFDVRYMLMLRSVEPLRLYAYNVFWLRFANRCIKHKSIRIQIDFKRYNTFESCLDKIIGQSPNHRFAMTYYRLVKQDLNLIGTRVKEAANDLHPFRIE